jgi:twitching motility protein PilT
VDLDLSYPLAGVGRFRVNVFMQRNGISAVLRLIPEEIKTIRELDLPEQLAQLIDASEGLILVTGPTGSGKSTTLSALIHTINHDQQAHIISMKTRSRFVHENQNCLISQRELASHTKSFGAALRAALREDPDIILVGRNARPGNNSVGDHCGRNRSPRFWHAPHKQRHQDRSIA